MHLKIWPPIEHFLHPVSDLSWAFALFWNSKIDLPLNLKIKLGSCTVFRLGTDFMRWSMDFRMPVSGEMRYVESPMISSFSAR